MDRTDEADTASKCENVDNAPDFDAEWEQFEAELQTPAKVTPAVEPTAISYPHLQCFNSHSEANVYSTSFNVNSSCDVANDDDEKISSGDSTAYSPSSEPMLDLFPEYRQQTDTNDKVEEKSTKSNSSGQASSHNDKGKVGSSKDSRQKSRSRGKSRSRSRSKDRHRSHRSKRDHHSSHRRSRSRERRHRHRKSESRSKSISSRSRSRSQSANRHRPSQRSESDRRRHDEDSRKRHDERNGLSAATLGNYGPRNADQIEKQRQLNAAVLNDKQSRRVEKKNTNGPKRTGGGDGSSKSDSTGGASPAAPSRPYGAYQKKPKFDPKLTPQERAAALQKQVEEATGIQMPKYYNPTAINPLKYAEQMQKRKLLWSKAKEGKTENESLWQNTAMALDSSSSNKFQKLMGLKSGGDEEPSAPSARIQQTVAVTAADSRRKQDNLFDQLDREYEFARMSTHTHRGMGLGFQSAVAEKASMIASINNKPTLSVPASSLSKK